MGIRGMQTYLERDCVGTVRPVKITEMLRSYRKTHPVKEPVIVVDGLNCMRWMYGKLDWVCSGQYVEFVAEVQRFVSAFAVVGIKLVFFFDGLCVVNKIEEWSRRRCESMKKIAKVFSLIKQRKDVPDELFNVPAALGLFMRCILKYECIEKPTVYANVCGECDLTIASYAIRNDCMAILAQDTDYVIYQTVPYISVSRLNLRTMETVVFDRVAFCQKIGLSPELLPLLATLLGNDFMQADRLNQFHFSVLQRYGVGSNKRNYLAYVPLQQLVPCVVSFIKETNSDSCSDIESCFSRICHSGFGDLVSQDEFIKAIQMYTVDCTAAGLYRPFAAGDVQSTFDTLLLKTINADISQMIFDVITCGKIERGPSLEDTSIKELVPIAVIYRPIRCRFYHLAFELRDQIPKEASALLPRDTGCLNSDRNVVEEWWFHPTKSYSEPDLIRPIPGILSDTNPNILGFMIDSEDLLLEKKWNCLKLTMDITISIQSMLSVPDRFKLMVMLLNYLIQNTDVCIKFWEVDVFLVQAVLPKATDVGWLKSLKIDFYDERAVYLAALFARGVPEVFGVVSICGEPFGLHYAMPWNYFDGKRFHYCYDSLKNSKTVASLCNHESASIEEFLRLQKVTLEGINIKESFGKRSA